MPRKTYRYKPLPVVRLHFNTPLKLRWAVVKGEIINLSGGTTTLHRSIFPHNVQEYLLCQRVNGLRELILVNTNLVMVYDTGDEVPREAWTVCPDMDYAIARALTIAATEKR